MKFLGNDPYKSGATLQQCQGDCDNDSHCAKGLLCFQRKADEKVPGCLAGGNGDVSKADYCYEDPGEQWDEHG